MLLLVFSILALVVGVAIYPAIRKFPASLTFFDAFVLISIIGLTLLHLIPHSVENAGIFGLIAVAVGLGIPSLLHSFQHHHDEDDHDDHDDDHDHGHKANSNLILLSLIFVGVIIHTILDGIGLSMSSGDDEIGNLLGLGVLFHRLPIGIFLGMMLVPRIGLKKTWGIVVALATSTVIGFILGHFALPSASITIMYVVQGLIAGSLLHVVFHNISVEGHNDSRWSKGLGALAGFGALAVVEWIAPVHAGHASVLDFWVDYLFNAAPIWCICAALMALCYGFAKSEKIKPVAQKFCEWLDPQPLQAASGGVLHVCSLAGITLLLTIFTAQTAVAWWVPAMAALIIARICLKNIDCCRACRPESLCNREKSFPLWTASSWTLVAIASLLAAVLPSVASPLTEWFETLPLYGSVLAAGVILVAMIAIAARRRGITIISAPLVMFAFLCLFHENEIALALALASGILLIFLYDYHARDIASAVEHDHPWKKRYALAAILCAILAFAPAVVLHVIQEEHTELTRLEPAAHHHHHEHGDLHEHHHGELGHDDEEHEHHHGELGHDDEEHEHHHGELGHDDEEHEHHHGELGHDDEEHEHHHGELGHDDEEHEHHHGELGHDDEDHEHHHDAHSGHAGLIGKMHEMPIQFAAFVLFMLTGLFWMLRYGPRHLFETMQGKHHHRHE